MIDVIHVIHVTEVTDTIDDPRGRGKWVGPPGPWLIASGQP
ncbi:hypothetical protein [Streptomyces cinnamoneus]|nr:hypothetical protein [Streptomyces cinnamoneus]